LLNNRLNQPSGKSGGTMPSIEEKVKEIIVRELEVDEKEVTPEASFIEDLGADSLDLTELIMAMEEEFNVEIGDEDALKLLKVKDAYQYIADHS
jgi:acyl carrier protein